MATLASHCQCNHSCLKQQNLTVLRVTDPTCILEGSSQGWLLQEARGPPSVPIWYLAPDSLAQALTTHQPLLPFSVSARARPALLLPFYGAHVVDSTRSSWTAHHGPSICLPILSGQTSFNCRLTHTQTQGLRLCISGSGANN